MRGDNLAEAVERGCSIEQLRQLLGEEIILWRETLADSMPPGHDLRPSVTACLFDSAKRSGRQASSTPSVARRPSSGDSHFANNDSGNQAVADNRQSQNRPDSPLLYTTLLCVRVDALFPTVTPTWFCSGLFREQFRDD